MNADESQRLYAGVEIASHWETGFKRTVRCASTLESED